MGIFFVFICRINLISSIYTIKNVVETSMFKYVTLFNTLSIKVKKKKKTYCK